MPFSDWLHLLLLFYSVTIYSILYNNPSYSCILIGPCLLNDLLKDWHTRRQNCRNLCQLRQGNQTSFMIVIFVAFTWWIINKFEKRIDSIFSVSLHNISCSPKYVHLCFCDLIETKNFKIFPVLDGLVINTLIL